VMTGAAALADLGVIDLLSRAESRQAAGERSARAAAELRQQEIQQQTDNADAAARPGPAANAAASAPLIVDRGGVELGPLIEPHAASRDLAPERQRDSSYARQGSFADAELWNSPRGFTEGDSPGRVGRSWSGTRWTDDVGLSRNRTGQGARRRP